MKSFAQFLAEIAVNNDFSQPFANNAQSRRKMPMVHSEEDPSHRVIPLTVLPRVLSIFRSLEGRKDAPWAHKAGAAVIERLLSQPEDGGMLFAMISNNEAESLRSFAESILSDSQKVMLSRVGQSIKDEAMKWIAASEGILKSLDNAIRTVNSTRS